MTGTPRLKLANSIARTPRRRCLFARNPPWSSRMGARLSLPKVYGRLDVYSPGHDRLSPVFPPPAPPPPRMLLLIQRAVSRMLWLSSQRELLAPTSAQWQTPADSKTGIEGADRGLGFSFNDALLALYESMVTL